MNDHSFEEVERLFDEVAVLPQAQQLEYLQSKASSADIIKEVRELLAAHDELGGFLTEPLQIEDGFTPICPELTGRRINVWQVDALIGQGGMGRVYKAHRADGEYEQTVAFKIVEIKSFNNAAFLRERQILADLDHPNITSLLDAGTLDEGFPYLVMEFIDGLPIDQYVLDKQNFSKRELIILFLRLCRIVQSAHGHRIIHCDLKPSNIFVTRDGILKLLDFGIAQSLISGQSVITSEGESFSFTPEYSSPNRHQQKQPTVADDIFSLGIIFAQLLNERTPKIKQTGNYPQPDLEKIAEEIDDCELCAIFQAATDTGKNGFLYRSMQGLMDDLERYLDKLPLRAVGKNFSYKSRKHLQRNWFAWLSGSLVCVLLAIGGLSLWQKQRAEQESRFIRELSKTLLANMDESLEQLPQTTPTRKLLITSVVDQLESFSQQVPDDLEVNKMLADTYGRLGVVTGSPFVLSLGEIDSARAYYNKALSLYEKILSSRVDKFAAYNEISKIKREIAKLYAHQNDTQNMQRLYAEMRTQMEQVYKDQPLEKQRALAVTYIVGAHGEMHLGNLTDAQEILDKARKILLAVNESEHDVRYEIERRFIEEESAHLLLLQKNYQQAAERYQVLLSQKPVHQHWRIERGVARVNMALGCIALHQEKRSEALEYFTTARNIYEALSAKYPSVQHLKNILQRFALYDQLSTTKIDDKILFNTMMCNKPQAFMMPLSGD